jgi:hypothetical protein
MLIIAASFEPIFGSGVDMGDAIGEVSSLENASEGLFSGSGTGAGAAADRLPRINSINLSEGTLIKTPCAPFVTTYKLLVNRWEAFYVCFPKTNPCGLLAAFTTLTTFTHDALLGSGGHLLHRGSSHTLFPCGKFNAGSYDHVLYRT